MTYSFKEQIHNPGLASKDAEKYAEKYEARYR
jgi:hypothetical protein